MKNIGILNKRELSSKDMEDFMLEDTGILCKGNRLYGLRKKQLEQVYTKEDVKDH